MIGPGHLRPPSVEQILRARLALLLRRAGKTPAQVAAALGHPADRVERWLEPGSLESPPLALIDEVLCVLNLRPESVLSPVLDRDDRKLLRWVAERTPQAPLQSHAQLHRLKGDNPARAEALIAQGVLELHGDQDEPLRWFLRLTLAGERARLG